MTGSERWRSLTLRGNVAFEQRDHMRARRHFEEALAVAEGLLAEAARVNEPHTLGVAPLLHGVACSNVVELARLQGDRETVGVYLYRRVSVLFSIIESPDAPLELRSRCLLHLKVAASGLYDYFEQGGMWDAAAAFSERANAAMFVVGQLQSVERGSPARASVFAEDDDDMPRSVLSEGELSEGELSEGELRGAALALGNLPSDATSHAARGFSPGRMGSR